MVAVGQYVDTWLKLTENWIGEQLSFIREFESIVVSHHTAPAVSLHDIYAVDRLPFHRRYWNRLQFLRTGVAPLHRNACRRHRVALLHAHFGDRGREALPLARALGVPLVTSFYGRDMMQHPDGMVALRRQYRELFASGVLFLAEGPRSRDRLIDIGCDPVKARIQRIGVDMQEIAFTPRAVAEGGELRVLMASRFVEKKGLEYGLRAFCRAAENQGNLALTIVGDANDTPEQQAIKTRLHTIARDSGLTGRIRFTGFLPTHELMDLARTHHVLLHPSVTARDGDGEAGHPVVMTQLGASGMPIIGTDHGDIPQLVHDGVTGWLCRERDIDGLTAVLNALVTHPDRMRQAAVRLRAHIEDSYDARRWSLDRVYEELLTTPS